MTEPPRKPLLIDWFEADAPDPGSAPPVPDADAPQGRAMRAAGQLATARGTGLVRLALWAFGALLSFALSVAAWDFAAGLLARSPILGGVAVALLAVAALLALALALREAAAFLRLGRLDRLRAQAGAARAAADLMAARGVVTGLERLYAARAELRWGMARLAERKPEVFDADGLLDLAETELLASLDQAARREVEAAARQVATVTALVPMALADVAMALFANLRMIRRIAEIYGGRAGSLGSWRLLRRVFAHLVATGAVALTDDLIGSLAGGGLLSKLSRRFGEGVVNGALTARVGVAAMDICRPLPWQALPRPRVTNLVGRALAGFFGTGDSGSDGGPDGGTDGDTDCGQAGRQADGKERKT